MWLYRLTKLTCPPLGRLYWGLRITGAVDEIPRNGGFLLASNHASYLDPWFIGAPFPLPIRFLMSRRWYERSRLWRGAFRAYGALPVAERSEDTIEIVCRALSLGANVGVFPEGRISPHGRIQRFHPGLSAMAARSGAPVLPVGLRGNYETLPKHRRFPRPARISIHVGRPRMFPGAPRADLPPRDERRRFLEQLYQDICRLSGQEPEAAAQLLDGERRGEQDLS